MKFQNLGILIVLSAVLVGCQRSDKASLLNEQLKTERQRYEQENVIHSGDRLPVYDNSQYTLFKRGGRFFIGPRKYGCYDSCRFYWPSTIPMTGESSSSNYSDKSMMISEMAVDIYFVAPSTDALTPRRILEQIEKNDWILSRQIIKPGLEKITQRGDVPRHELTLYVATDLKGPDGLPPVAQCFNDDPSHGGGSSFMWKPEVTVSVGFNQRHCVDWPEIYSEVVNVLNQVSEVQP